MNFVPGKLYKVTANRTLWKEDNGRDKIGYLTTGNIVMFLECNPIREFGYIAGHFLMVLHQDKIGWIYNHPLTNILKEVQK